MTTLLFAKAVSNNLACKKFFGLCIKAGIVIIVFTQFSLCFPQFLGAWRVPLRGL